MRLQVQWEVAKPLLRPAFKLALVGQLGVATKLPLHKRLLNLQALAQLPFSWLLFKAVLTVCAAAGAMGGGQAAAATSLQIGAGRPAGGGHQAAPAQAPAQLAAPLPAAEAQPGQQGRLASRLKTTSAMLEDNPPG